MKKNILGKTILFFVPVFLFFALETHATGRSFYELIVYHIKDTAQENATDFYLQNAFIPAMHRLKIEKVGVFKPIANDTAQDKTLYVFFAVNNLDDLLKIPAKLNADEAYKAAGKNFIDATFDKPCYARMETIVLYAFPMAPQQTMPNLKAPLTERVYELRSYESATEKIHENKVDMFNAGGEIPLFKRLNYNAVFYAQVIAGSRMPNLMYMTTFENIADREAHWKTFGEDAEWKTLSAKPEYQHNVSKIEVILMHPTAYSDF